MYNIYRVKKRLIKRKLLGGSVLPFHILVQRREYIWCLCTISDNNSQLITIRQKKIMALFWLYKKIQDLVLGRCRWIAVTVRCPSTTAWCGSCSLTARVNSRTALPEVAAVRCRFWPAIVHLILGNSCSSQGYNAIQYYLSCSRS